MDLRKSIKRGIWLNLILILLIAYGTTHTLNPGEVLARSNPLIKIVLLVLSLLTALQLLSLLVVSLIPEDAVCSDPDCAKSIRTYLPVLSEAVKCYRCGRWYHKACWIKYNKTEPTPRELMRGCKICRGEELGRRRLFEDEDIFGERM